MKKTRIQMYEKNMRVEMFLGRSHDCGHCIGSLCSWGRRKKRMKTLGMRKAFWKFGQIFICIHTCMYDKKPAYKRMKKTRIQIYEWKTHTNVWRKDAYKHAFKWMTKTRIQMNAKNTHTKSHTNVWEKHAYKIAYKCMRKTRIQMYEKKQHTNVWQKHAYKHVYKFMKKTPKNVWKKYTHIMEWLTANYSAQGVWDALLKGTSAVTRR